MTTTAAALMRELHGTDIYAGFVPTFALDLQGWNSYHPAFRDIIARQRPSVVIDVGVWKGASTIGFAELLREYGIDGTVIAVDTFLSGSERWNDNDATFGLVPRQFGRPMLYEQFLANVVRSNVADTVIPMAQTSVATADVLGRAGIRAGLIHIDAAHDYDSVLKDADLYWELLAPGGYLVGDDYHLETWPGVFRAANDFSARVGVPIEDKGPKWIVRKPVHI